MSPVRSPAEHQAAGTTKSSAQTPQVTSRSSPLSNGQTDALLSGRLGREPPDAQSFGPVDDAEFAVASTELGDVLNRQNLTSTEDRVAFLVRTYEIGDSDLLMQLILDEEFVNEELGAQYRIGKESGELAVLVRNAGRDIADAGLAMPISGASAHARNLAHAFALGFADGAWSALDAISNAKPSQSGSYNVAPRRLDWHEEAAESLQAAMAVGSFFLNPVAFTEVMYATGAFVLLAEANGMDPKTAELIVFVVQTAISLGRVGVRRFGTAPARLPPARVVTRPRPATSTAKRPATPVVTPAVKRTPAPAPRPALVPAAKPASTSAPGPTVTTAPTPASTPVAPRPTTPAVTRPTLPVEQVPRSTAGTHVDADGRLLPEASPMDHIKRLESGEIANASDGNSHFGVGRGGAVKPAGTPQTTQAPASTQSGANPQVTARGTAKADASTGSTEASGADIPQSGQAPAKKDITPHVIPRAKLVAKGSLPPRPEPLPPADPVPVLLSDKVTSPVALHAPPGIDPRVPQLPDSGKYTRQPNINNNVVRVSPAKPNAASANSSTPDVVPEPVSTEGSNAVTLRRPSTSAVPEPIAGEDSDAVTRPRLSAPAVPEPVASEGSGVVTRPRSSAESAVPRLVASDGGARHATPVPGSQPPAGGPRFPRARTIYRRPPPPEATPEPIRASDGNVATQTPSPATSAVAEPVPFDEQSERTIVEDPKHTDEAPGLFDPNKSQEALREAQNRIDSRLPPLPPELQKVLDELSGPAQTLIDAAGPKKKR